MIGDFIASNEAQIVIGGALLAIVGLLGMWGNRPPVSKGRDDHGFNTHGYGEDFWSDLRETWRTK